MMQKKKTLIVIAGPTASGKTALSLQLAKHFNTSIISADSRQCFKELNIGVAKPTEEELQSVKHYFINSHSIFDEVTAATFEAYAADAVKEIFKEHDTAIMVGGTGLYIKAFCEGLDAIPAIDPLIRKTIQQQYDALGLNWLQSAIKKADPAFWEIGEQQNPQRLMRALEVINGTGESILSYHNKTNKQHSFIIHKTGIDLPREILYDNINKRVDIMMEQGLLEEVSALLPYKELNALQTVGYKELFEYFEGSSGIEKAVDNIKLHTRHYAKRQLTWFRKDSAIKWVSDLMIDNIVCELNKY
jgi:tRNA dimethylallyltransferase